MIKRNAAKCLKCNSTIESKHVHDFVSCACGNIFVDGGREYIKRGGHGFFDGTAEDLSETIEES